MATVKIEEIIDHLGIEMKKALEETINQVAPGADFSINEAFRYFLRAVERKCNIWENVPDRFVNN